MTALETYQAALVELLDHHERGMLDHYPATAPRNALTYGNHAAVRRALEAAGSHFYDRQALRFFNAKTSDPHMAAGRFWVESKRYEDDPRTYQVAWISGDENHLSVERSREFSSLDQARKIRTMIANAVAALDV